MYTYLTFFIVVFLILFCASIDIIILIIPKKMLKLIYTYNFCFLIISLFVVAILQYFGRGFREIALFTAVATAFIIIKLRRFLFKKKTKNKINLESFRSVKK